MGTSGSGIATRGKIIVTVETSPGSGSFGLVYRDFHDAYSSVAPLPIPAGCKYRVYFDSILYQWTTTPAAADMFFAKVTISYRKLGK